MKKIKYKLKRTSERGLIHNGRADARLFAKVINDLINRINELSEEIEILRSEKTEA